MKYDVSEVNAICHDLDLLDEWLSAKGYTEEAGLCLRVLGLIRAQAKENEKLRAALAEEKQYGEREHREKMSHYQEVYDAEKVIVELRAEVATLREALKPFDWSSFPIDWEKQPDDTILTLLNIRAGHLRAAAAALKETGDE